MIVEAKQRVEQSMYPLDKFRQELEGSNFGKLFLRVLENRFSNEPIEGVEIALFLGSVLSVKTIIKSKGWDIDAQFTQEQAIEIALEQSTIIQNKEKYNRYWTEKEVQRGYFSSLGLTQAFMDDLSGFASHDWQKHPLVDTATFFALRQLGVIVAKGRANDKLKESWRKRYFGKNSIKQEAADKPSNGVTAQEEPVIVDPDCIHHWVIAAPNGAFSEGLCKRCGSTRSFKNATLPRTIIKRTKRRTPDVIIDSNSSREIEDEGIE